MGRLTFVMLSGARLILRLVGKPTSYPISPRFSSSGTYLLMYMRLYARSNLFYEAPVGGISTNHASPSTTCQCPRRFLTLRSISTIMPKSLSKAGGDHTSTSQRWSTISKHVSGMTSSYSPSHISAYPITPFAPLFSLKPCLLRSKWKKFYSSCEITRQG
jgi:hypothetical protein